MPLFSCASWSRQPSLSGLRRLATTPALKRRAILSHPSGVKMLKSWWRWASRPTLSQPSNSSQTVMSSRKHRGRSYLPYAFTEQGVAMLSSVLRSPRAVQVNIAIMRAFVRLREMLLSQRRPRSQTGRLGAEIRFPVQGGFRRHPPAHGSAAATAQTRNRLPRQRRRRPLPHQQATKGLNTGQGFGLWALGFGLWSAPAFRPKLAKKTSRLDRKARTANT